MRAELGLPADPIVLGAALEGLMRADMALMRGARARGRTVPRLYASGVRYRREAPGAESWDTWDRVLARGWGDCEDLASWRAAELRVTGGDPGARPVVIRTGPGMLHAVVRRSSGALEDPSRRLGMVPSELAGAPAGGGVAYRIQRVPGGWIVRVGAPGQVPAWSQVADPPPAPAATPGAKAKAKAKAKGKGKAAALRQALRLAMRVAPAAAQAAGATMPAGVSQALQLASGLV